MLNAPYGNTVNAIAPTSCPVPNRNGCAVNLQDPWSSTPGGDPLVAINYPQQGGTVTLPPHNVAFPLQGTYVSMPINVQPMQVTQWNVSYQRQVLSGMLFDVTYIGNMTTHIWVPGYAENPAIYIPGNCVAGQYGLTAPGPCSNTTTVNRQARALLTMINPTEGAYYGVNTGGQTGISQSYTDGTGHYNGVKFTVSRRMAKGWSVNANYTYSKCINQGEPATDIGDSFPVPLIDPINNPHPDATTNEGPCAADRRHNFNLSAILLSRGVGPTVVNALTRNWQAGVIWQARSGSPITPTTTGDFALTGSGNQRPVIVPGVDPYLSPNQRVWATTGSAPSLAWFNLNAFAPNSPGSWGNTPKGYLFGPSFWNVDASFSRNLDLGSGHRVELRVEAFNLFDHLNWANPSVVIGSTSPTNGRVTNTTGDPRIMQFAIKYGF
jgi:hypothetical protein